MSDKPETLPHDAVLSDDAESVTNFTDDEHLRVDGPAAPATASDELSDQVGVSSNEKLSRAARPLFQLPFAYGETWQLATYPGHDDYDIDMTRVPGPSNNRPILAAYGGKVVAAGWGNGGGNYVRIDHGHGWETLYLHMIRPPVVRVGQRVSQGHHIGNVGSTGNSSGPHLHYEQLFDGAKTEAWFNGKPSGITDDVTSKPRIVKSYNREGADDMPLNADDIKKIREAVWSHHPFPNSATASWLTTGAAVGQTYLYLTKDGDIRKLIAAIGAGEDVVVLSTPQFDQLGRQIAQSIIAAETNNLSEADLANVEERVKMALRAGTGPAPTAARKELVDISSALPSPTPPTPPAA
jgi:hypothetical protein